MSTRQSRLVYDQGARPCPRQSYRGSIAASNFVSGNIAGVDHAPDIDGGGNAVDGRLPIYSNTSLPTRH